MRKRWWLLLALPVPVVAVMFVKVGEAKVEPGDLRGASPRLDLSGHSDARIGQKLRVLFVHHSVGGQWLADPGADDGGNSIHRTHSNGGGLRRALEAANYEVHEASYGSAIGDATDLPDWPPLFRERMDDVLRTSHQDERYADGTVNRIVMFKSCFPNNDFTSEGTAPGDAASRERTVWNAKAVLSSLLPHFRAHPETLFVYVTIPPTAPRAGGLPIYRWLWRTVRGRPAGEADLLNRARLARELNDWVVSPDGWLADYEGRNVVAFDFYDVMTGHGRYDLLYYPTGDGFDSHPSSEGQRIATEELVPFLNRAVRRAGLVSEQASLGDPDRAND
jgi:hypothetical protein